jgi:hypothetical protein
MSPGFGASGQWWAKTRATGFVDFGEPDGAGVEDLLDGEAEAAVAGEQRPDP